MRSTVDAGATQCLGFLRAGALASDVNGGTPGSLFLRDCVYTCSALGERRYSKQVLLVRPMSETIEDRALRVIATKQGLPLASVRPECTFEELGIDSLDRLNILFELEGEFDIQIDDEQAKQVTTLQQMIDGITQLMNAKAQTSPGQ